MLKNEIIWKSEERSKIVLRYFKLNCFDLTKGINVCTKYEIKSTNILL